MRPPRRREFLLALGSTAAALSGCVSTPFPGSGGDADVTLYVGAYHWGFVLLDESGTERERVTLDPDTSIKLVAFNTSAEDALDTLPSAISEAIPDHEALEERNEERIPPPSSGDLHDVLEEANARYPNHSLAVMPSGRNHMGGGMGGMMLRPIPLPADATSPTTAGLSASQRGNYTLSCLTDCGYGHPYMELEGALVVR
jgi:hypothetical protein